MDQAVRKELIAQHLRDLLKADTDIYSAFAEMFGVSRQEAKTSILRWLYSGEGALEEKE